MTVSTEFPEVLYTAKSLPDVCIYFEFIANYAFTENVFKPSSGVINTNL